MIGLRSVLPSSTLEDFGKAWYLFFLQLGKIQLLDIHIFNLFW